MISTISVLDKSSNIEYYLKGVVSIQPTIQKTVTEYPTTEGSVMSDHVYREPASLSLSLFVNGMSTVTQSYYVNSDGQTTNLTYEEFKSLVQYWENNAVLLDIQTLHRLFKNVTLTSINWSENSTEWTKFKPTLGFKEIKIATISQTKVTALTVVDEVAYSPQIDTGEVSGTPEATVGENIGQAAGSAFIGGAIGKTIGAVVGSFIPGGTAIGGAIGGLLGGAIGFFVGLS